MGEARRRREARIDRTAQGLPVPRPGHCPACRSKRVSHGVPSGGNVEYGVCAQCRAVWEAFPPMMVEDSVCAEPCDNCAFRPGSPEQSDPEKWKALIDSLNPRETAHGQWFSGKFHCHKGVPIDMTKGPGNFLFPLKPNAEDGADYDISKMRTCSGFLRMFWAKAAKMKKHQ